MVTKHNFESMLPKDQPCHACFKLADWFQRSRLLNNFPLGAMGGVFLEIVAERLGLEHLTPLLAASIISIRVHG